MITREPRYDITLDHVHNEVTHLDDLSELVGGLLDASEVTVEADVKHTINGLAKRLEQLETSVAGLLPKVPR